jgi:hypothetical protein
VRAIDVLTYFDVRVKTYLVLELCSDMRAPRAIDVNEPTFNLQPYVMLLRNIRFIEY